MKTALRSLFVWLLLLALPWQGVAAARMLPAVGAGGPASMAMARMQAAADASHSASHAAPCAMHAPAPAAKAAAHDAHDGQSGHGGGSCASCCIGVALAPTPIVPPVLAPPDFIAIPFRAGHVTSADPSLPERPPRPLSA